MKKEPFVTKAQLDEIIKTYPTPFHLYDEKGMRENMKALKEAFSWNKGYREYFAVKATPNPFLINILREYGCGCDCSSYTELMLSDAIGATGEDIMFSSNDTPAEEFVLADKLNAIINLDDITHIDFLEKAIGHIPETISCRYNPGGMFKISNDIMDNPGDAKYGMTTEQIFDAFKHEYIALDDPFEFKKIRVEDVNDKDCVAAIDFEYKKKTYHIEASGNGPLDAVKTAINKEFDLDVCVLNYSEHALGSGSHARAAAYIEMRDNRTGKELFGAGDSSNITKATIRAFFSGLNRLANK